MMAALAKTRNSNVGHLAAGESWLNHQLMHGGGK
jgi:hypothetical protein